jgi:hypothetical protein
MPISLTSMLKHSLSVIDILYDTYNHSQLIRGVECSIETDVIIYHAVFLISFEIK